VLGAGLARDRAGEEPWMTMRGHPLLPRFEREPAPLFRRERIDGHACDYNRRRMATRQKQFHTVCQEEVYRQVKAYLDELVDEHFDDAEHCDFYLKYGSTVLEISINPYDQDDAVIEILAFCVQGVEPTPELMSELLQLNTEVLLGGFSMVGSDVFFSHSFLGRRLRPEQLIASLENVASTSDEYDEQIVGRFGGETALERLRSHTARASASENN